MKRLLGLVALLVCTASSSEMIGITSLSYSEASLEHYDSHLWQLSSEFMKYYDNDFFTSSSVSLGTGDGSGSVDVDLSNVGVAFSFGIRKERVTPFVGLSGSQVWADYKTFRGTIKDNEFSWDAHIGEIFDSEPMTRLTSNGVRDFDETGFFRAEVIFDQFVIGAGTNVGDSTDSSSIKVGWVISF